MNKKLLEQLYNDYGNALLLYIYSICRDFGTAEELMQETFVKALLSLSDSHANLKAWLFLVGKNLTLNRMKSDKKVVLIDEIEDLSMDENVLTELITNEKNRKLYQAMLGLPYAMRQVLILKYFSGFSYGRIGEILGISPGNARNTAYRARSQLRERLEDDHDIQRNNEKV